MTGSYDEWDEARRLVERGGRKLSDYGGELPGIEPPEEWRRYFDWQRRFRTGTPSDLLLSDATKCSGNRSTRCIEAHFII